MIGIPSIQARPLFTQAVVAVYRERISPTAFLRSFFRNDESLSRYISIEVIRGMENVAVDVYRKTEGNRNTFGKSTEKVFDPPYFREFFDLTDLDYYDMLFNSSTITDEVFADLVSQTADKMVILTDKIERAYELQCSQVLTDGVVQLKSGDNIDFKRKALSLVDLGGGNYWDQTTVDPDTILETGARFIREQGKSSGGTLNVIFGSKAFTALVNNAKVLARKSYIKDFAFDMLTPQQRSSTGASFHGELSVGSYSMRVWTYPQVYNRASDKVITPYIDDTKIIILPETPKFVLAFASVPQLIDGNSVPKKGAYLIKEFKDEREASHIMDIQSAGLAVPVAVDQIYTAKVVA